MESNSFDLEAIEKRHAAGAPAKEDLPSLIAEVKRLSQPASDHQGNETTQVLQNTTPQEDDEPSADEPSAGGGV